MHAPHPSRAARRTLRLAAGAATVSLAFAGAFVAGGGLSESHADRAQIETMSVARHLPGIPVLAGDGAPPELAEPASRRRTGASRRSRPSSTHRRGGASRPPRGERPAHPRGGTTPGPGSSASAGPSGGAQTGPSSTGGGGRGSRGGGGNGGSTGASPPATPRPAAPAPALAAPAPIQPDPDLGEVAEEELDPEDAE